MEGTANPLKTGPVATLLGTLVGWALGYVAAGGWVATAAGAAVILAITGSLVLVATLPLYAVLHRHPRALHACLFATALAVGACIGSFNWNGV